jgi:hypothetical protein
MDAPNICSPQAWNAQTVEEIKAEGEVAWGYTCDVSSEQSVHDVMVKVGSEQSVHDVMVKVSSEQSVHDFMVKVSSGRACTTSW